MGSIPNPVEPTSFDDFQKQTSLMTSCTLLWKELSDHFTNLEEDLRRKSEALKRKIMSLDDETKTSLDKLKKRERTIESSIDVAIRKAEESKNAALRLFRGDGDVVEAASPFSTSPNSPKFGEVDDSEGVLTRMKDFCAWMDYKEFWKFVTVRKKELESLRSKIPLALSECVDPPKFVLEAMSEVFPVDKKGDKAESCNDLGWACVLLLESLIPVVVDPVVGKDRLLLTPSVRRRAEGIAETWKKSLEERGGIENVKTPDVHTFLQHLVTFGIVKKGDVGLYRKLVVGSAWRKQMPKLAVSLGLADNMPDMIEELISRGQQVDAVHFTYEVGLVGKFPPVPLLKSFLKDAKKAAAAILEDPNNSGRTAHLANRKEQSALRAVLKCIEEYKLEDEFPSETLKKRLEQLERTKIDNKKRSSPTTANKRTRVCNNNGPMPPAKAGRLTNAYVSSFPPVPAFIRSPSQQQYPAGPGPTPYTYDRPAPSMYGTSSPSYSPQYHYSPEAIPTASMAGPYSGAPISYPAYCYSNGMSPSYVPAAYY